MIGSTLQRILDEKGFNVNELAKMSGVSAQTLYSIIKRDNMKVDIDALLKICRALNIPVDIFYRDYINDEDLRDSLSRDEMAQIEKYRTLDEYGKKAVRTILDYEVERKQAQAAAELAEDPAPYASKTRYIAFPDLPVSAGTGICLVDDSMQMIEIPLDSRSVRADYILRVSGDSMEPDYHSGDVILVQSQPEVESGELGIFTLNGEGFFKKWNGNGRLISLNPTYPDVVIGDGDSFKCLGRVLGKVEQ